ncbi:MAG: DUF4062 domain-containing protein [Methanobrevibacter sp.]|nr:DUF4062 domain-containing protein [Methanobrevibacter sp.]
MEWKSVTIFISSTFNDMHAERDYLVKNVFPELREWCEEHKIHLQDIDLRWGVTKEESKNAHTVGKCLKNIDKSRPFFLCFLGQRRGWVPDNQEDISEETVNTYPSIRKKAKNKSVTEIEIEHALLKPMYRLVKGNETDCPPVKHALFFFREDNYTNKLNDGQKCIYTNKCEKNPEESDEKLEEFKETIKRKIKKEQIATAKIQEKIDILEEKHNPKTKPVKARINELRKEMKHLTLNSYYGTWDENLTISELAYMEKNEAKGGLKDFKIKNQENDNFKELIIKQLQEEILKAFPENAEVSEAKGLQKEQEQQDNFRELNTQGFIERTGDFDDLNSYIHSDDKRLFILTAKAGLGKTTLIANYITNHLKDNDNLIYRFAGVSDDSSNEYNLWSSILEEAEIEVPPTMEKLEKNKEEIFNELAEKNLIIIIDGINQITNGLAMTDWIDKPLLPNLKLILSFKEDEDTKNKIDNIKNNNEYYFSSEILPLDNDKDKKFKCTDRKKLINKYLENYLKALDEKDINIICESKGTKNPLLLKILLSELRLFGVYEELSKEIKRFGKTPETAFDHVLERLEKDDTINGFVQLLFGLLANVRVGLSTTELKEIISKELKKDENLITDSINLFLRQVKPFMSRREGRIDYFYDSIKIAAKKRYENEEYFNGLVADYFLLKADPEKNYTFTGENSRDFNELPYHLAHSNKIATLEDIFGHYTWIKNNSQLNSIFNTIIDYKYINIENKENYHLN